MKPIHDAAGDARRAWLRDIQDGLAPMQSDFEKSPAFRLSLIVAAVVVGLSVFAPPPASSAAHVAIRATVWGCDMAKHKRNQPSPPEVSGRFVAALIVIAIVIAGAKMGSRMNRSLADNPSQVHVV